VRLSTLDAARLWTLDATRLCTLDAVRLWTLDAGRRGSGRWTPRWFPTGFRVFSVSGPCWTVPEPCRNQCGSVWSVYEPV
jgi:hypothetical protein